MGDIRFVVRKYIGEGLVCLPVKPGEKATRLKDWAKPETKPTEQDFEADYNVAQRLDNVVDIDCDCHEARFIAERLLPLTRASTDDRALRPTSLTTGIRSPGTPPSRRITTWTARRRSSSTGPAVAITP
jgi:hypothetical protein